jgi:SIR2-like domain
VTDSASTSRLISKGSLENGHALSFKHQPYFKQLMQTIRVKTRMTLVVGAGVSMDSGLPDWTQLLSAMADQITDPVIASIAKEDTSDQLRKAEYIQSLIMGMTAESPRSILRRALYPDDSDAKPGELAEAIARLIAVDPSRFQLLTTNFDNMLEQALERHLEMPVISVGLNDYEEGSADGQSSFPVVHLHGMVTRNDKPKPLDPVIVTESEFLRDGYRVKTALLNAMRTSSSVVFVGVSLTDPNLVGPLWETSHPHDSGVKQTDLEVPKYVFSVVSKPTKTHVDFPVAARIMRYRSEYNERLGARPILLKSYSQLVQAFSEMGLCAVEPANYVQNPSHGQSTRYGARFSRAITQAYQSIGTARGNELPKDGATLSENLHKALYGRKGLVPLIEKELRDEAHIESLGDEKFALFLWLRRRATGKVTAPYGVVLIGSSAYVHREEWSFKRPDAISYNSEWMASRCLFMGGLQITNGASILDGVPRSSGKQPPIWNGILARPLILRGFSSPVSTNQDLDGMYDRLVIGSVTLNSTYCMVDDDTKDPNTNLSALSTLKASDRLNEVSEKLNAVVLDQILYPDA